MPLKGSQRFVGDDVVGVVAWSVRVVHVQLAQLVLSDSHFGTRWRLAVLAGGAGALVQLIKLALFADGEGFLGF